MKDRSPIVINARFDSGNISVIDSNDHQNIRLEIRQDTKAEFLQWFYFSASGLSGSRCRFVIENAGSTSYPQGWTNYHVVTSEDRQIWLREPAVYDGQSLSWTIDSDADQMWFAYFAPYSTEQHADLISAASAEPGIKHEVLALTEQGRPLDYLRVEPHPESTQGAIVNKSQPAAMRKPQVWIIARQHPGESMAEWFMEGLLDRLLDENDATSRSLRSKADLHLVPNMNPDGVFLGNLRTNALGVNLNREWSEPDSGKSPEVYHVLERMKHTGVDMALDVHGDEALPYNFIAGSEGVADWSEERNRELVNVKHTWSCLNPDFQDEHGYPINQPGKANLSICSNQLANRFNCLAMTLEMPFKDTANLPSPVTGWSPERSMRLGASFIDVAWLKLNNRLLERG